MQTRAGREHEEIHHGRETCLWRLARSYPITRRLPFRDSFVNAIVRAVRARFSRHRNNSSQSV